MKSVKRCYACDEEGTTVEHVPARCIFLPGYRENHITVPSCEKHNSQKSREDEYLRHILVMSAPFNLERVPIEKALNAIERRPHLMDTFMPNREVVHNEEGEETGAFTIDRTRFDSAISFTVRALHFHEYKNRLDHYLLIDWDFLRDRNFNPIAMFSGLEEMKKILPPLTKGNHPEIFQYAFNSVRDQKGQMLFVCRLRFYQGAPIYAYWANEVL